MGLMCHPFKICMATPSLMPSWEKLYWTTVLSLRDGSIRVRTRVSWADTMVSPTLRGVLYGINGIRTVSLNFPNEMLVVMMSGVFCNKSS